MPATSFLAQSVKIDIKYRKFIIFSPTVDAYTHITRAPSSPIGYVKEGKFIEQASQGKYSYYKHRYPGKGWDVLGCIPIVRSFSGSLRAFLGTLDVITGLALALLTQDKSKLDIAAVGAKNILFGALEVGSDVLMISSLFACAIPGLGRLNPSLYAFGFIASVTALPIYLFNTPWPDPSKKVIYAK